MARWALTWNRLVDGRGPIGEPLGVHAALLPGPLVDATWLAGHLDDVVVVDVRSYLDGRSGHDAYVGGHLPGAVFASLDDDLAGPPTPEGGRHPLPDPEAFAVALGRLGVGERTPVVAYDDAGGAMAARFWWMLHVLGRPAAVLDGGIGTWGGPLEEGEGHPEPVDPPPPVPWPTDRVVGIDEVAALAADPAALVLDARSAERYRGDRNPVDERFGHVPGAVSAPFVGNLVAPAGRFLDPAALRARFEGLGVASGVAVAVHCGSGVTACHDLLALEVAGLGDPGARLFVGSWSAWTADPARPVTTGEQP